MRDEDCRRSRSSADGRADDAAELVLAPRADALRAEDRRGDADRNRRKLHVADDLVDRAVRRRRVANRSG